MITEKSTMPMNGASKAVEERRALRGKFSGTIWTRSHVPFRKNSFSKNHAWDGRSDAYLAGGAFAFRVIADAKKCPGNADPYKVRWAQSISPDESQIWMTFENKTQYPGKGKVRFRVFFTGGKASSVEVLDCKEHT